MDITLTNQSSVRMPRKYLENSLNVFCKILNKKSLHPNLNDKELSLVFLDPKEAKKINNKYRNKNYPTDVLSFTGFEPSLGELVMCPQVLQLQAEEQNNSFREEVLYMVIHGVLHLLGYDHETNKADEEVMFTLQDELFQKTLLKLSKLTKK